MTGTRLTQTHICLAGFLVVLILAWFCYQPALTGAFQLDDHGNLSGLAAVEDNESAWNFILSGEAGPTGRPIALWTFTMQADEWHNGAEAFLRANILIHLFNGILLAVALYLLGVARARQREHAVLVAVVTTGLWLLMPLLATASLQVVQRMTTLSGTFVLAGLVAYLLARPRIETAPTTALACMSAALVIATTFAVLTKEIGVLLPAYVLVLEATVLTRPTSLANRAWRAWYTVFLVLPTVFVLGYLATRFSYPEWTVARRGFTGWERLLTETQVLWVYLQKALLGVPSSLGLYQTPPVVSRSLLEPATLTASLVWLGIATAAIVKRRRWPLFALAALWYLTGHVMESTWLSLELYFEHRNYLPVIGPLYAIIAFLMLGPERRRRFALAGAAVFALVSAYFLYTFSSLSGEPSVASRFWATRYPESVRAVTNMAAYQLVEEGPLRALETIDRFAAEHPQFGYLRIQELNLRCLVIPEEDHGQVVSQLHESLPEIEFTYTAGTMLSQLLSTVIAGSCNGVDFDTVEELALLLYDNPRYTHSPGYSQFHYKLLAGVAQRRGSLDAAIGHIESAIEYRPSSELNMMMVTALAGRRDFFRANAFIDEAHESTPLHPFRARVWRSDLENLREYVAQLEKYSENAGTNDEP